LTHRLVNPEDLTSAELLSLRLVVSRNFTTQASVPAASRGRLLELGLIQRGMGGLLATPSGRICARF
jgi:hypothetical protein